MTNSKLSVFTVLLAGACASPQTPDRGAFAAPVVEAVYACAHGPIVVIGDHDGPFLLDGSHRELVTNSWRSARADHFVILTRSGSNSRPVALEYLVPLNRAKPATLLTYDHDLGASFKVMAESGAWRVLGEPSSTAPCQIGGQSAVVAR